MDLFGLYLWAAREEYRRKRLSERMEGGMEEVKARRSMERISGVGGKTAKNLYVAGFKSRRDVALASLDELMEVDGIGPKRAEKIKKGANSLFLKLLG